MIYILGIMLIWFFWGDPSPSANVSKILQNKSGLKKKVKKKKGEPK